MITSERRLVNEALMNAWQQRMRMLTTGYVFA